MPTHSFLLDPSFLNSFLPLEKKLFFFLPCGEQSVFDGLSAGRGAGGEQQASTDGAGRGAGAGEGSDAGLEVGASLGGRSVCSAGSGRGGSAGGGKASSRVEAPGSCSSVEDVQVSCSSFLWSGAG